MHSQQKRERMTAGYAGRHSAVVEVEATVGAALAAAAEEGRKQAVFQRRAVRLAAPAVASGPPADARRLLVFRLGSERYGIELADVAEVLPAARCTPVPGAPAHISGVIEVRGEIRPVLDLKLLLGILAEENVPASAHPAHLLLVRLAGGQVAVRTDGVEGVRAVARDELRAAGTGNMEGSVSYITGITADTLMVLSTQALLIEFSKEISR